MLHQLNRLSQRLRLLATKALVDSVDDSTPIQLLKVLGLEGEVDDAIERIQEYGFSSVPPKDSEVLLTEVGGSRDNMVVTATDSHDYRPMGSESGEVVVYSQYGQTVHLKADGSAVVTASQGAVTLAADAGSITIQGNNVTVDGNLTVTGTTTFSGAVTMAQTLAVTGAVTMLATLTVTGILTSLVTGLVTLGAHTHAALNAPPTPGS